VVAGCCLRLRNRRLHRRPLSSPSVTFGSRGGVVVSSLVSHPSTFACVHWVFGLMRRCRSRTLTVFGELLSQLLKIGRSAVRPRPWPLYLTCTNGSFLDLFIRAPSQLSARAILYRSGREWTTDGILAHMTYPTVIRVMVAAESASIGIKGAACGGAHPRSVNTSPGRPTGPQAGGTVGRRCCDLLPRQAPRRGP
jgi:hypothetical protein